MSGDVFGNGMLLSNHIKLVAASTIGTSSSILSRIRCAAGRSVRGFSPCHARAGGDTSLLSEGGGVFPRTLKSIAITEQMRNALGIDKSVQELTPAELIKACLRAPVDPVEWRRRDFREGGDGDQRRRGRQDQ